MHGPRLRLRGRALWFSLHKRRRSLLPLRASVERELRSVALQVSSGSLRSPLLRGPYAPPCSAQSATVRCRCVGVPWLGANEKRATRAAPLDLLNSTCRRPARASGHGNVAGLAGGCSQGTHGEAALPAGHSPGRQGDAREARGKASPTARERGTRAATSVSSLVAPRLAQTRECRLRRSSLSTHPPSPRLSRSRCPTKRGLQKACSALRYNWRPLRGEPREHD